MLPFFNRPMNEKNNFSGNMSPCFSYKLSVKASNPTAVNVYFVSL